MVEQKLLDATRWRYRTRGFDSRLVHLPQYGIADVTAPRSRMGAYGSNCARPPRLVTQWTEFPSPKGNVAGSTPVKAIGTTTHVCSTLRKVQIISGLSRLKRLCVPNWKGGRAAECVGLLTQCTSRYPGFESLSFLLVNPVSLINPVRPIL